MQKTELSPIQLEILNALEALGEKARYSEAVLAKKIREKSGIEGKKKAGIGLLDLEKAIEYQESNGLGFYAVIMNSANDLLIEKTAESRPLQPEARQRRIKSEKSISIFTNADLGSKKSKPVKAKKRTENRKLSIYSNFDDLDE